MPLPDGAGKQLVESLCTACHRTNMITASMGYTRDGWKELIGTMIDLSANEDMRDKLSRTTSRRSFPPNTTRARQARSGPGADVVQGMGDAARSASARAIRCRPPTA